MTTRLAALGVGLLVALAGALAFGPWFRADLVGREVSFAGIDAAPVLWIHVACCAAAMLVAVALVATGVEPGEFPARVGGLAIVVAALFALVVTLTAALGVTTEAVPLTPSDGPPVALVARPLAWLTGAALASAAALACLWMREGAESA